MSNLPAVKEQAKKYGVHLTQSPAFSASFQSLLEKSFPYKTIAEAQTAFGKHLEHNDELWQALTATQTVLATAISNVQGLEHYVQMHIPKMECGGNFGVTIQLQALKEMSEARDKWTKHVEELAKYAAARADAMDKLGLVPQATQTETTTQSSSQVVGGKDGDENKTSTTTVQETKTTSTKSVHFYRQQAVVAVDVYYYTLAQTAVTSVRNGYLAILDFIEKNQSDLEKPRGTSAASGYSNMY